MSAHQRALEELRTWVAPTSDQERLRTAYVEHMEAHPDGLLKGCFPAHLTAGALVVSHDRTTVLMNHHRKAGIWVAFGGHIEPQDDSLRAAALREATEESGIAGLVLADEPAQLDVHSVGFCSPPDTVHHLDVRFVAIAPVGAQPVVSDESHEIRWFAPHDVPTDEEAMRQLIARAFAR